MKIKLFIICVILLAVTVIMSFTQKQNSKYYYAYNEKIYLTESENKLTVRYNQNKHSDKLRISLYSELVNKKFEWIDDSTCIITFNPSEKELFKDKITQQADIKTCSPIYTVGSGMEMGVADEFLVKFNENVSKSEIDKLHKKFRVEVVKISELFQLLKVPSGSDVIEIANFYQESGLTRFSHPNFIDEFKPQQVIPNDPFFQKQFSLNNTGQVFTDGHSGIVDADIDAPEAWVITKGSNNIIIAVVDDGLTPDHPDLPNSRQVRLNGSNFSNGDPNDPSPTDNYNHGNACAGIIAATQNNNQGISGIAPNCRIMPIRVTGVILVDRIAQAIDFAWRNGADILSLSRTYDKTDPNIYPSVRDAIINATTKGRNGLGCVVVNSAGNNFINNGPIHFPSNVDVSGVLTVGASDRYDLKAFYSPLGNPASPENQLLDIVAPSHRAYSCQIPTETLECWSIDIPGDSGYNPVWSNDCGALPGIGSRLPNTGSNYLAYTGRFGGTSYSCPQVAGVAALILSINPALTQQQVFDILTTTADKVGGYVYTNGRSNELGFGKLNACRAVFKTATMVASIAGPNLVCSSGATFTVNNLPTGCSVSWTPSTNLRLSSASGNSATFTPNGSGNGWVQATLTSQCYTQTTNRINVIVGSPAPSISARKISSAGEPIEYRFTATAYNAASYHWYVNGVAQQGETGNTFDWYFPCGITKTVKCKLTNSCGTSAFSNSITKTGGCDRNLSYSVSPNPASSTVTISTSSTMAVADSAQITYSSFDFVRVFDFQGNLKKSIKYSRANNASINVAGLQGGSYVFEIGNAEYTEKHQVIVEK